MKLRLAHYFANPLSFVGGVIAAIGFGSSTVLLLVDLFSASTNPYTGILSYAVFPTFIFVGIGTAIIGAIRQRKRTGPEFPVLDLNDPRQRRTVVFITAGSLLFLLLSALGGYKAYEFTDDVAFCGELCHTVMEPEYTAYLNSPHARVGCVDCHVGPGAEWFVKAKISGLYQVYAVLANKFPRPIATPIKDLRPAQQTCERCHWPEKFWGAQLATKIHYGFDAGNTRREILMLVKTGGGGTAHGPSEGIHWHMNIRNKIEYLARDDKRMDIPWVKVTYPDSTSKVYVNQGAPPTEEELQSIPPRRMDCMDCHNRPSHTYLSPASVVDELMAGGQVDARVPYIKTEATSVLAKDYATKEEARQGIESGLTEAYSSRYPDLARTYRREIQEAIPALQTMYEKNFFPEMKANWSVYPTHISHKEFPGCFRCHSGTHQDEAGNALSKDCSICHSFVSRTGEGEATLLEVPADPTLYHPWSQASAHSSMDCWNCHVGSASPYGKCGECHEVHNDAPMAFACSSCHRPIATATGDKLLACQDCHAIGGSELHMIESHRSCDGCHEPHEWKASVPDTCAICHGELAETHYPEQACTACHDFGGVTSGFGVAPIPPALIPNVPKKPDPAATPPETGSEEGTSQERKAAGCLAADCHADMKEKEVVHGPVASGACSSCHRETDVEEHEFELVSDEEELCSTCHVFRHAKKTIHPPFEQKQCLGCHDPHGGASRAMLTGATVEELCTLCHAKVKEGMVHQPYADGDCVRCHLSHQSDEKALLRTDEPTLCMGCHEDVKDQLAQATVIHKPVAGGCQECHRGHASPHANLLKDTYPGSFYAPFDEASYQLCFQCHAKELFTKAESSLTSFRNGTTNLHYLHVNQPEKGRTCRACHASHGSTAPKLVRDEVPFGPGGWKLPIDWTLTKSGGSCTTGCHRTLSYDRESPVTWSEE